jgi:Leucine-rich repeat (LRR) protein
MDFFKYMEALRVSRSRLTPPLYIMFTCSLKILNLSNNNLGDLSFLTNCQDLEFLNVNYNSISNLSNLKNLKCLIEIHCFGNLI